MFLPWMYVLLGTGDHDVGPETRIGLFPSELIRHE